MDPEEQARQKSRQIGYLLTVLATFSLGTTEIFAPWYAGILGGSSFQIGLAMGSFGIVYMFAPYFGGSISDKIGRKKALILSSIVYLVLLVLYIQPFVTPNILIVIRAVEGFVFGIFYPSVEAMVAELKPEAQNAVLGNFSVSWSAGMIASPFVLSFMSTNFGHTTSIYVVLVMVLISIGLIVAFVQDSGMQIQEHRKLVQQTNPDAKPENLKASRKFLVSYLSMALWGFASTIMLGLFPSYIEALPNLTTEHFGYLLVLWNFSRTVAFFVASKTPKQLLDTFMKVGALFTAGSFVIIVATLDFVILMGAMVLSGVGIGFLYLSSLYNVVSATETEKGEHAGLIESLGGVGFFIGPLIGGFAAGFNLSYPYLITAVYGFVTFLSTVVLLQEQNKRE